MGSDRRPSKTPDKRTAGEAAPAGGAEPPVTRPSSAVTPVPAPAQPAQPPSEAAAPVVVPDEPETAAPVSESRAPTSRKAPARAARGPGGSRRAPSQSNEFGEEGAPAAARGRSGDIGTMARRGMSMAHKLLLFTLVLTLPISIIFGIVSLRDLETQLLDEIDRSGKQQALLLNAFGQRVIERFRGSRERNQFQTLLQEYQSSQAYRDDLKNIQMMLKADKRIKDVVIFAAAAIDKDPSTPVLRATSEKEFAAPQNAPNDEDVHRYWGRYGAERCRYFFVPLERAPDGGKVYSFASIILSASEIESQVGSLRNRLLLFGSLLIGLAIVASLGVSAWFTRPINMLVEDINTVSQGDLDHVSAVPDQTNDEVGLLAMAFNRMTRNLRAARDSERDRERIEGELNTAKAIHAKLMPEKLPQIPGLDIFTAYNCAKEVGGDYYDFIPIGDMEHMALCVADVSGKGIPGSMVMGTTRTVLRMMAMNNLSAADVLSKTNFHVARDIKRGMFVTCNYAILNLRTREMTVASAGHNPMLIWRAATQTIEKVRPNGIALGFDKGPVFQRTIREQKVQLEKGDRVLMYTDGVVESMNEAREEWGDEALDTFTLTNAPLSSKDFVRLLIKALEEHQGKAEQHDDITITTFRLV